MNKRRIGFFIKNIIFLIYVIFICYGLFFAEGFGRSIERKSYNLIPFKEIGRYLSAIDTIGPGMVFINLIGNVVLFLPFGYLMPSLMPKEDRHHPAIFLLTAMILSAFVELMQFFTRSGVCDIDDVILNTTGALIGYIFYRVVDAISEKIARQTALKDEDDDNNGKADS